MEEGEGLLNTVKHFQKLRDKFNEAT